VGAAERRSGLEPCGKGKCMEAKLRNGVAGGVAAGHRYSANPGGKDKFSQKKPHAGAEGLTLNLSLGTAQCSVEHNALAAPKCFGGTLEISPRRHLRIF